MSATAKGRLEKLGIIAGGGSMPARLLHACDKKGIEPFIIAFDGQTDPAILHDRKYMLTRIGAAGLVINTLRAHGIQDLVFIGSIRRPSLREMRPDMRTLRFFGRLATRAIGDDGLLRAIKKELEKEGFRIHGVQAFANDLLVGEGPLGRLQPKRQDEEDIVRGLDILQYIGALDIGQGVVVQEGIVLGVEAAEGTDELIRRCGLIKRAGRGPVLIKIAKPGQDKDLDLPTIGPDTVSIAGERGFRGIIIEAGKTLVLEPEIVGELADRFGMFVEGRRLE